MLSVDKHDGFAFTINEGDMPERLTLCAGGVNMRMLIDSGATSNVMGENAWEKLKAKHIKCHSYIPTSKKKLYSYSSSPPLTVKGAFTCEVSIENKNEHAEFIVIRGNGEPLMGKLTVMHLGVLRIGASISAVTDIKQALQ